MHDWNHSRRSLVSCESNINCMVNAWWVETPAHLHHLLFLLSSSLSLMEDTVTHSALAGMRGQTHVVECNTTQLCSVSRRGKSSPLRSVAKQCALEEDRLVFSYIHMYFKSAVYFLYACSWLYYTQFIHAYIVKSFHHSIIFVIDNIKSHTTFFKLHWKKSV